MINSPIDTVAALKYFAVTDKIMHTALKQSLTSSRPLIVPTMKKPSEYFTNLTNSIISQQISTKAAAAVRGRVEILLGNITPERVQAINFDSLKACGLSVQKTKYIKHNAELWHEVPTENFIYLPDEAIVSELTKLYGVGRWTAEMFLIFSLARSDVFSYGDLGLKQSLYRMYNYKPHYVRKIYTTVDQWSPHRTLASLALWHALDNEPVLL